MTATARVALVVDNTGTQKQCSKRNTPPQSFLKIKNLKKNNSENLWSMKFHPNLFIQISRWTWVMVSNVMKSTG